MSASRTVVLADDHPLFRRGLLEVLKADGTIEVVGEAGDGEAALELIRKRAPRFAILDIDMPKASGLDVARAVQREGLAVQVVVLTMHKSRTMLDGALDAGVTGYVLKENATSDILACLNLVAEGGTYISPAVSQHLVARRDEAAVSSPVERAIATLSPTEREVLRRIAADRTTREIARELGIKPKTVEHHRGNICAKLELRGSNALVRFAVQHRHLLK